MDTTRCIVDFPPDLHERAEAAVAEGTPNLEQRSPEELRGLIHELRVDRAESDLRIEALQQACADQTQRAEEAISLLERSPDVIVRIDRELHVLYANPAFEKVTGFPEESIIGHAFHELDFPEDRVAAWEANFQSAFDTGMESNVEFEYTGAWGRRFYNTRAVPEHYDGDRVATILATSHDITDLKRAEEKLARSNDALEAQVLQRTAELEQAVNTLRQEVADRERAEETIRTNERLLSAVLDTLPSAVFVLNHEGEIIRINPAARRIWGGERYAGPEEYGEFKAWRTDTGVRIEAQDWAAVRAIRDGETTLDEEIEIQTFDRAYKIILNSAIPLRDDQGAVNGAIVVNEDITDRKMAEVQLQEYRERLEELVDERTIELEAANVRLKKEIAERKQIEKSLRESEENFRLVLKNAPIGLVIQDRQRRHVWMYSALLEKDIDKILGKREEDMFSPEGAARLIEIKERVMATGNGEHAEMPLSAFGGPTFFFDVTIEPIRDTRGNVTGVSSVTLDITERKRAEDALRESEERFRSLADNANAVIAIVKNKRFIYANPYFERIIGYTLDEIYASDIAPFIHPEDREMVIERAHRREAGEPAPIHYEFRSITRSGDVRWIDFSPARIMLQEEPAIIGIGVDITERKRAEAALRESEERFREILEYAPVGMSLNDLDGRFIYINKAFVQIVGYSGEELQSAGITFLELTHPDDRGFNTEIFNRLLAGEIPAFFIEKRYVRKDGDTVWARVSVILRRDPEGHPQYTVAIVEDITDRKRTEESLRESEEKFRSFVETSEEGIWVLDMDGKTTFVNRKLAEIFGVSPEEMIGKSVLDFLPEADREKTRERLSQRMSGVGERYDFRYTCKDGTTIWTMISGTPLRDNGGRVIGTLAMVTDITDRKRAEEALRESEARLRRFYESGLVGVAYWNMEGKITDANDKFLDMIGYSREDLATGKIDWINMTPPEYRQADEYSTAELKATGVNRMPIEKEYVRKNSTRIPILIAGAMLDAERFNGVAFILDITERKRAEEALRESEVRFRAAVDNFPGVFLVYDSERHIQYVNRVGIEKSGHSKEEIIGHLDEEVYPSSVIETYLPTLNRAIETKEPQTLETRLVAGKDYWVIMNIIPLTDERGNIWQILIISYDITARRNAEDRVRELNQRLRQQTAQLTASNKELESFSYSISHDLRAPLRSLDGFSLALEEDYADRLDEQGKDYIARIRTAAQRMARLIDDVLQLSRTNRAEIHYTPVDLSAQARSVVEELRQAEPGRNVEAVIQEGITVEGDETLLRQVLQNLLGNAWKFTAHQPSARIEFGEKRENDRRIFFVRDNGAGFDMTYAENLFVPFRRLHSEDEFPGTGIGLSIVKRIVERHSGAVWAESEPGNGATFYFTLGEE